jgi:hypothetical protein
MESKEKSVRELSKDEKEIILAFLEAIGEGNGVAEIPSEAESISECGVFLVFPRGDAHLYTKRRDFDAVVEDNFGKPVSLCLRIGHVNEKLVVREFEMVSDEASCDIRFPLKMDTLEIY